MRTRAKFECLSVTPQGDGFEAKFMAIDEAEWSRWTPAGSLSIYITNPAVSFEVGKAYWLDLEQVG